MYVDKLVDSVMETTWVLHNRETATFLDVRLHTVKVKWWLYDQKDRQQHLSFWLDLLCAQDDSRDTKNSWNVRDDGRRAQTRSYTGAHTQRNSHTFCGLFDLLVQPTATVKTKGGPPAEGRGIVAWEWVKIYQSLLDVFCISSNNKLPERLRLVPEKSVVSDKWRSASQNPTIRGKKTNKPNTQNK